MGCSYSIFNSTSKSNNHTNTHLGHDFPDTLKTVRSTAQVKGCLSVGAERNLLLMKPPFKLSLVHVVHIHPCTYTGKTVIHINI